MADDSIKEFDGYIMGDGEMLSLDDSERVLAIMTEHWSDKKGILKQLCRFVLERSDKGKDISAHAYAEKMLLYAETAGEKAYCLLCMGQLKERLGDCGEALKTYLSAMDLAPERNDVWYFLNNNLGYCLNRFGRHTEASQYCRAAIGINRKHHNAFKNLGVALQGRGEYSKAADAYIKATRICPRDGRALNLLEELVSHERDHLVDIRDIMVELKRCRDLVERAAIH
jgi:tetratricopeptide (TPR) repeat protein